MGNTFTSWSGLVLALQQEVAEATAEVIDACLTPYIIRRTATTDSPSIINLLLIFIIIQS